jgi:hypothetical protein
MSNEEAAEAFKQIRWHATGREPFCPRCGCVGVYDLKAYAVEMAWREDNRRRSNGEQYLLTINAALSCSVSRQWKGYWQRSAV